MVGNTMIDTENLVDAVALLRDENLVWDNDFDRIRDPLLKVLLAVTTLGTVGPANTPIQIDIVHQATNKLIAALVKDA
jgi:hypothetical protein